MADAARDAPLVARAETPGLAVDREIEVSRNQDPRLLVGVGVVEDFSAVLELHDGEHEPFAGRRADLDSWKDLVDGAVTGGCEVGVVRPRRWSGLGHNEGS